MEKLGLYLRAAVALSTVFIASCGGGSAGPTSPAQTANVAGSWSGTSTMTVTSGPPCIVGQPFTATTKAQIAQSGAAISGTLGARQCSFHGMVSGTTISWTQDAQQASFICQAAYFIPCFDQGGGIQLIDVTGGTSSLAGTVSGNQISASGSETDNLRDPATGHVTGTLQYSVQLTLQRQ
ncbi:MAG TPA: hypothetical protein VOA80_05545 [Thermoanaerobaculia bacterium]|nr:hypothetical protein [Thermoanaerobaculia bacterium]